MDKSIVLKYKNTDLQIDTHILNYVNLLLDCINPNILDQVLPKFVVINP